MRPSCARARFALSPAEVRAVDAGAGFVRVMLPTPLWMPDGNLATSVLVGRVGASLRAYVNLCRHHPDPLDADGVPGTMSPDGTHLLCHAHGALYRPDDGYCVSGPCMGATLFPARAREESGGVVVEVD